MVPMTIHAGKCKHSKPETRNQSPSHFCFWISPALHEQLQAARCTNSFPKAIARAVSADGEAAAPVGRRAGGRMRRVVRRGWPGCFSFLWFMVDAFRPITHLRTSGAGAAQAKNSNPARSSRAGFSAGQHRSKPKHICIATPMPVEHPTLFRVQPATKLFGEKRCCPDALGWHRNCKANFWRGRTKREQVSCGD